MAHLQLRVPVDLPRQLQTHLQVRGQFAKLVQGWLRAHAGDYELDPDRFGAWGSSAGGHLVALLGTTGHVKNFNEGPHPDQSSRVQAVFDRGRLRTRCAVFLSNNSNLKEAQPGLIKR